MAPNPSPMTLEGTNGYVIDVGPGALVAIDPGVADRDHIDAFLGVARETSARYVAILATHGHPDHYPGALALRSATGAPVYAHPAAAFAHDEAIDDGAVLAFAGASIDVLAAPGHAPDHLVFWLERERALFTGDVVIGRGTVVIAPPSGDMRAYQRTLERLLRDYGHAAVIHGGHGPPIDDPRERLRAYIAHRRTREDEILASLSRGPATIPALVASIYHGVDETLWPAAGRQVLAYLLALQREGRVRAQTLHRPPTAQEAAVLHPDWGRHARPADAAVVRAELGFGDASEALLQYELAARS